MVRRDERGNAVRGAVQHEHLLFGNEREDASGSYAGSVIRLFFPVLAGPTPPYRNGGSRSGQPERWFDYDAGVPRDPIERPAPADLELLRAFVNTHDLDKGTDELGDTAAAARWLKRRRLRDEATPLTPRDLGRVIEAREAFRGVLVANATGDTADQAVEALNTIARRCGMTTRLSGPASATTTPSTARGVDIALGRLLAITFDAIAAGTWSRLKACPAPTCHWAFYDRSRNRTSRWCDMGLCGNRAKRQAQRRRAGL
jgi:predicted RNA-binding Zn ribbon-like protein